MRTTGSSPAGSDTHGGGFSTDTTNMATDLAATNANTSAPVVTSASYTFITRDEGHWIYIAAGTNWTPGWYQIASTSGGAATLTATAGSGYLASANVPYAVTTAVGCATVASPTGGTWSVDYSQNTTIAWTDLVINGAVNTSFTSAAKPFGVNFVGNTLNVTGGTGFTVQRVQIVSVSGTTATSDKSMGTLSSTGGTANGGGPLATPGLVGGLKIAGNTVFIKNGDYTCSNSSNVAGGRVTDATAGSASAINFWVGWDTARHIQALPSTRPALKATANSVTLMTLSGTDMHIRNINATKNASETSCTGFAVTLTHSMLFNCAATSINAGFTTSGGANITLYSCIADTMAGAGFTDSSSTSVRFISCVAKTCTGLGFSNANSNATLISCIAYDGGTHGFSTAAGQGVVYNNCTSYDNAGAGFLWGSSTRMHYYINCVATGNGGASNYQFDQGGSGELGHVLIDCAAKADGLGLHNLNAAQLINFVTLTADPFNNAAGGDFGPNSTAGGGVLLKAAAGPGTFPGGLSTSYMDIGAIQSGTGGPVAGGGGAGNIIGTTSLIYVNGEVMDIPLDEVIHGDAITSDPATGAATDADATPTFAVYEESTDTDIGVGGNMTKRTSLDGNYRWSFTASAANGFEVGKWYSVIGSAVVGGETGKAVLRSFRIVPAESVTGQPKVDVVAIGGVAQSATDLKDFADDGYDPSTNKVQGVVLVDTLTTYTGNTPQTGDLYGLMVIRANTAQTGTTSTIRLDASASATNSIYNGMQIVLTGGTGADQVRTITGYNGTTKQCSIDRNWQTAPDNTTTFAVLATNSPRLNNNLQVQGSLALVVVRSGTAQAGSTSNTIKLDSGASSTNNLYTGNIITIDGGTGQGQTRSIVSYNGTTKFATVDKTWVTTPDNTSTFDIYASTSPSIFSDQGVAQAGGATSITLASTASATDNIYNGSFINILSGTGSGQTREITAYNGTTKVATVDSAWSANPDSTSAYAVIPSVANDGSSSSLTTTDIINAFNTSKPTISLDMTQAVPTSNTDETVGDALNAARAQGFGDWEIVGSQLLIKDAGGSTLHTFDLDSLTAPTSRTTA